ncbi:hypothetical protein KF840_15655 [bacterium]|nr:hypothetical protein [bacterium]
MRRPGGSAAAALAASLALLLAAHAAHGAALDEAGELSLGVRSYTAARVGSQHTDISIIYGTPTHSRQTFRSLTFPVSPAGHMRQSRYFLEAELRHNLDRLIKDGFGPLALINDLPVRVRNVKYNLTGRFEYDGVYDYGPAEYRTAYQYYNEVLVPPFSGRTPPVLPVRRTLRNVASWRARLFQAFLEADVGKLYLRFGRQILAWGETDAFRLLDNINPLDNSFGGFLVPLDERRLPLDMLRTSYQIGDIPFLPFYDSYLEGFAAVDNAVAIQPGIPNGSPWQLPNFQPSAVLLTTKDIPPTNLPHTRGGLQFKFSTPLPPLSDAQVGIASYWTYLDTPAVQTLVQGDPNSGIFFPLAIQQGRAAGYLAQAVQTVPTTQITGASITTSVPADYARYLGLSGEPVLRSELAYFSNEARFTQAQLDPFVYALGNCTAGGRLTGTGYCTGGRRTGDSWNYALGIDHNQFIRWLNPGQSIFFSAQFFYKHLNGAAKRVPIPAIGPYVPGQPKLFNGEVLPVPAYNQSPDSRGIPSGASESVFIHQPVDQYLNTLLVATQYFSGQVAPALGVFYDWGGAVVAQPQVTLVRDPFRFTLSYSYLYASTLKGGSGISLLRDRDNVLFQLEYVI